MEPVPSVADADSGEPDWVFEDGWMVATRSGLLRRGYCCGNGCRNCPYVGTPLEHPDRPPD